MFPMPIPHTFVQKPRNAQGLVKVGNERDITSEYNKTRDHVEKCEDQF